MVACWICCRNNSNEWFIGQILLIKVAITTNCVMTEAAAQEALLIATKFSADFQSCIKDFA